MKIEEAKIRFEEIETYTHGFYDDVLIKKRDAKVLLDQIETDKPKPVVPQFVAEWLKKYRYAHTLLKFLNAAEKEQITTSAVNDWILDNQYDFIKAWIDGYEEKTDETE